MVVLEVLLVHAALILGASSPKKCCTEFVILRWCAFFLVLGTVNDIRCFLIFGAPDNILSTSLQYRKVSPEHNFGTLDESGIKAFWERVAPPL